MTRFAGAVAPMVTTYRSGLEESVHHGVGVAIDGDGRMLAHVGAPTEVVYARSTLKPLQTAAMVELGLELSSPLLALVCSSHNGEAIHCNGVREILQRYDLDELALRNTPAMPYGAKARRAARSEGLDASSLLQNCSGKHAGMLATCVVNGWSLDDYLEAEHPLQQAITGTIGRLTGEVHHLGVDGCGAPAHAVTIEGLARSFGALVASGSSVARAMSSNPNLVAGDDRDVTAWMRAVDGLVAKEGAAGVMALALPDGRAAAFKIADGSDAARQVATVGALRALGVDLGVLDPAVRDAVSVPVLGHGRPVGWYEPVEWSAGPSGA
jgi:L-asparaginase II